MGTRPPRTQKIQSTTLHRQRRERYHGYAKQEGPRTRVEDGMKAELKLRNINSAQALFTIVSSPHFQFFHEPPKDLEEEQKILAKHIQQNKKGSGLHYDVWVDGEVVGGIGGEEKNDFWQAGYFLDEKYWGKGIIPQLFKQFEEELWGKGVTTIKMEINNQNTASIRVAEKLGFLRGEEKEVTDRSGKNTEGYWWVKNHP
jgi:RimJ/RimL family protein N-acetyltransferase